MKQNKLVKCSNPKCGEIIQWQTDKPRDHRMVSVPLKFNGDKFVYCSFACQAEHEATLDMPEPEKFNVNVEKDELTIPDNLIIKTPEQILDCVKR